MVDVRTAVAALRSDAKIWGDAGNDLDAPRQAIGSLGLTGSDVSMYGVDHGIDKTYADAQSALQSMLQQATQNFHALAGALQHAADLYDQTDADNQQRLYRLEGDLNTGNR
jgi:hypothetical protein